jgi:hypothetical protein
MAPETRAALVALACSRERAQKRAREEQRQTDAFMYRWYASGIGEKLRCLQSELDEYFPGFGIDFFYTRQKTYEVVCATEPSIIVSVTALEKQGCIELAVHTNGQRMAWTMALESFAIANVEDAIREALAVADMQEDGAF